MHGADTMNGFATSDANDFNRMNGNGLNNHDLTMRKKSHKQKKNNNYQNDKSNGIMETGSTNGKHLDVPRGSIESGPGPFHLTPDHRHEETVLPTFPSSEDT